MTHGWRARPLFTLITACSCLFLLGVVSWALAEWSRLTVVRILEASLLIGMSMALYYAAFWRRREERDPHVTTHRRGGARPPP